MDWHAVVSFWRFLIGTCRGRSESMCYWEWHAEPVCITGESVPICVEGPGSSVKK